MAPFQHHVQSRKAGAIALLIAIYAALIGAIVAIDAAPWLMGALAVPTLPALADIWTNRRAGLCLDDHTLSWYSGRTDGEVTLKRIAKVRFERRFDFSIRVSVLLTDGKRLRLPYEALPKGNALAGALERRGVAIERNPFSIL